MTVDVRYRMRRVAEEEAMRTGGAGSYPDVEWILEAVRAEGDRGVARIAATLGDPPPRAVESREIEAGYAAVDASLRDALHGAAERIERFANAQRAALGDVTLEAGGLQIGHRFKAIARVGIYVPSGRHPLPSSLLMCAIPAFAAGVGEIVVCTPKVTMEILAAARVAGIERILELGGAQAIAALAYGTESIAPVDLIAGPGNAYVTAAKRAVFGTCGIDALAGPSEILVVASEDAYPAFVAADLLAQAEHDDAARAMLVTDEPAFADAIDAELGRQLAELSDGATARRSLAANGWCCVVPFERASNLIDAIAPEHLALQGARAQALAATVSRYGAIFVGSNAAEVFGDYGLGPNHVLPTGRAARYASGLSVLTFLTVRTFQRTVGALDPGVVAQTSTLARSEGLEAHARAALLRARSSV